MTPPERWAVVSTFLALAAVFAFLLQRRFHQKQIQVLLRSEAQSEEELWDLSETKKQLFAVFQGMREAIILIRQDGEILLVNPAFEKSFGVGLDIARGKNILEVLRNKDLYQILRSCLEEKREQTAQIEILSGQEPRAFEVRTVCLAQDGKETSALAVLHDVTALQRAETVRRDFVANVSHELRTPLGAITGYVETLLDGAMEDPKECREFLKIIQTNASRLQELIDDLLDLAKIESQGMSFQPAKVNVLDVAQASLPVFQKRLEARKLKATADIDPDLFVLADPQRLKQVFNNLLDNAVKFNREGGSIRIGAVRHGGMAEVSVEDTGKGIPPEEAGRVFERFYRVDKDRQRLDESGTGLGLSIAKHIVEKLGGRIWVVSEPGKGSIFRFTLPSA